MSRDGRNPGSVFSNSFMHALNKGQENSKRVFNNFITNGWMDVAWRHTQYNTSLNVNWQPIPNSPAIIHLLDVSLLHVTVQVQRFTHKIKSMTRNPHSYELCMSRTLTHRLMDEAMAGHDLRFECCMKQLPTDSLICCECGRILGNPQVIVSIFVKFDLPWMRVVGFGFLHGESMTRKEL